MFQEEQNISHYIEVEHKMVVQLQYYNAHENSKNM